MGNTASTVVGIAPFSREQVSTQTQATMKSFSRNVAAGISYGIVDDDVSGSRFISVGAEDGRILYEPNEITSETLFMAYSVSVFAILQVPCSCTIKYLTFQFIPSSEF